MATHLAAWQASVDQATLAAIANIGATETFLTRDGANRYFVPPGLNFVHWAYAVGPSLTRAQIVTPSIGQRRMSMEIVPARRGTEVVGIDGPRLFIPYAPIRLDPGENIEAQTAEDAVGASQQTVFMQLGPQTLPPPPAGEILALRATGTTTLVVRAWTAVALTLDVTLPVGEYAVIGFIPVSANAVMARLVPQGGGPRAGMPALAQTSGNPVDVDPALLSRLMGYEMGRFTLQSIPQVEFYATVADTAETVYLYVVKVA